MAVSGGMRSKSRRRHGLLAQGLNKAALPGVGLAREGTARGVGGGGVAQGGASLEFVVDVMVEEDFQPVEDFEPITSQLEFDGPKAVQTAMDGWEELDDVESVELSLLLCSDTYIRELNLQWRGEDKPTDVLSFPQQQPPGMKISTLLLGDVVISVETAARQAAERGHSLLTELRILLVHGLLHVLGFDHERGEREEEEMAAEESRILSLLGWQGNGLIAASATASPADAADDVAAAAAALAERVQRVKKPRFKLLFCDMDGTLLDSSSRVLPSSAEALRAAAAAGVKVVIATGKARPAAMIPLSAANLTGENNVISLNSPGVFLQGLRVYGHGGTVVHNALLPDDVAHEGFAFSLQHRVPLVGFSGDICLTLFDHPKVDLLHTRYYEPKAKVFADTASILREHQIQKLLFYDHEDRISDFVRPHWSAAANGRAAITQAVSEMLEILPPGQSKGSGVKLLLDHLNVSAEEVMAIGDGENDLEMVEMVGWGVAMANGSKKTKDVANAIVSSNDEHGIAEAIEKFILS